MKSNTEHAICVECENPFARLKTESYKTTCFDCYKIKNDIPKLKQKSVIENVKCDRCGGLFFRKSFETYKTHCTKCYILGKREEEDAKVWFRDD